MWARTAGGGSHRSHIGREHHAEKDGVAHQEQPEAEQHAFGGLVILPVSGAQIQAGMLDGFLAHAAILSYSWTASPALDDLHSSARDIAVAATAASIQRC